MKTPEEMARKLYYTDRQDDEMHLVYALREAFLAGYEAAEKQLNSPEKPDSSNTSKSSKSSTQDMAFAFAPPAREWFRIIPTEAGFDIRIPEDITLTEAAERFIEAVRDRLRQ